MKKISIKVLGLALIAALGFGHAAIVRADDERLKDTEHVTLVPAQETKG